jgi:hypothetical protein
MPASLPADKAEVFWDTEKKKWVVRIQVGAEAIRRNLNADRDADEATLKSQAEQTARDEGYEIDTAGITVRR